MKRSWLGQSAAALLVLTASPVGAASGQISLSAVAPVVCNISLSGTPLVERAGVVRLGDVRELCNTPNGYRIQVAYAPGTLIGATLTLGSDQVLLDGSGLAIVSDTNQAGYRTRALTISAPDQELDTSGLDLRIQHKA